MDNEISKITDYVEYKGFKIAIIDGHPMITQEQISNLLAIGRANLSRSLQRLIRRDGQVKLAEITTRDGKKYMVKHYPITILFRLGARSSSQNEVMNFHPIVSTYLMDNGFEYEHHPKAPIKGIIDFMAWRDNRVYIVECKIDGSEIAKTITQIQGYQAQFDEAVDLIVAVPIGTIKQEACERLATENIELWELEGYGPALETRLPIAHDFLSHFAGGDINDIIGKAFAQMLKAGRTFEEDIAYRERLAQLKREGRAN